MALDFVAGCLGGCAGVLVGYPFDTIKVHMQTQDALRPVYRGTFHCMQTIVQKESVAGLYRGITSPLGGVALINAVVFGVYGNVQRRMADPDALSTHFYAGAAAGLAQSVICSPIELAKTRVQVQLSQGAAGAAGAARGPLQCLVGVARAEGPRGVWRGLGATAGRDAPGIAVYFVSYEWLARTLAPADGQPLSTGRILFAGGLAGTVSWISSFPLDVVKSRLQVDGMNGPRRYAGAWDCWRQSVRAEGPAFLWRGLTSTVLRAFPMNAATFAVVTWVFRVAGAEGSAPATAPAPATEPRGRDVDTPLLGAPLLLGVVAPLSEGLRARQRQLAALVHGRRAAGQPHGDLAAAFRPDVTPSLSSSPSPFPFPSPSPTPSATLSPSSSFSPSPFPSPSATPSPSASSSFSATPSPSLSPSPSPSPSHSVTLSPSPAPLPASRDASATARGFALPVPAPDPLLLDNETSPVVERVASAVRAERKADHDQHTAALARSF